MMKHLLLSQTPTQFNGGILYTTVSVDSFTIKFFDRQDAKTPRAIFYNLQFGDTIDISGTEWEIVELEQPADLKQIAISENNSDIPVGYLQKTHVYETR